MLEGAGDADRRAAPMFGRPEVADEVERLLREAQKNRTGHVLLLVGAGGVGKSTLLQAAAHQAQNLGYRVLRGRSLPVEIPRPFGLIEDLLRTAQSERRTSDPRGPSSNSALPLYAAVVSPSPYPDAGAPIAAPLETGAPDEADRLLQVLASPVERIDADRATFFGRLLDFFLALARDRPLFLSVDDVHHADESSIEFLRQLATYLDKAELVVVATQVPFAEVPARAVGPLERLSQGPNATMLWVRPMTENELGEFVRWLLHGRDPGRDAVMRWFSQTEGNPLFTEYLVRATTGFGRPAKGERENASPDLDELIRSRIRQLSEGEMRVLVHAAVLGKEFDFRTLEVACGQEEERLSEHVDRLVQDGILREKGGEVYEFVSERVRVDVYTKLTETRRHLLHRKIARALVSRDGITSANLYELARQFYLGRDDAQAVDLNRKAAEAAAHAFAFDTAAVHLERALESQRRLVPRDVGAELRLLIELGKYHDELGDLKRSEEVLQDAVERARTLPEDRIDLALALLALAQTRNDQGQFGHARELGTEAFEILEKSNHRRGLLAAHRVLGVASWRMGDLAEAERHQRAGLALAETDGTSAEHGHALIDLANTFSSRGVERIDEALALYETAAGIFADIHDPSAEARVLMNRALLHHFAGQKDDSLRVMQQALAAAERSRSPIWIGYCSLNLAQFHTERGDAATARPLIERAGALLDPLGDQLAHQQVTMTLGMIAELENNLPLAEQVYMDALTLARDLAISAEIAEMHYRLARLYLKSGDVVRASRSLAEAKGAGIETLHADLQDGVEALALDIAQRTAGPQG